MKVFVMRHGTTIWNLKGITQGRTNNRLSKSGRDLTNEVALRYKDIKFDIIFSSPLMRTIQTSNIINKYHGVKIIKDHRLIEIDQGIFSGRHKDSLTEEEKVLKFSRAESCGMESYRSVYVRTEDFIKELSKQEYKSVLIVTHNVCASIISDILNNIKVDFNDYKKLSKFSNAEIKCFEV